MAWTVPRTWSAGELVTASIMNSHVRDNFNGFSTQLWIWTGDQTFNDNVKVTLGTGGDADIYYDATNLVIDPAVVGSGGVDFTGCDIGVDTGKKFHFSGLAGDTYVYEDAVNTQKFVCGGDTTLLLHQTLSEFRGTSLAIPAAQKFYLDGGVHVSISEVSADVMRCISVSGGVDLTSGATAWVAVSDERLKTGLEPITDATRKLGTLRAVTGYFKESERFDAEAAQRRRSFLIAQDVQAVLPEAVYTDEDGFLGLKYSKTIPLLVAGINELADRVNQLEERIQ